MVSDNHKKKMTLPAEPAPNGLLAPHCVSTVTGDGKVGYTWTVWQGLGPKLSKSDSQCTLAAAPGKTTAGSG